MAVAIDSDVDMGREDGIRSERVRNSWMSYACSQTDNLFPHGIGDTHQTLLDKRAVVYEHLDALRATENLLRQRLNHLLPIYRLPDEILARVLVYSCAAKRTVPTFPDKLMMVSRKWYSVVCSFPEIWTYPPWTHSEKCVSAFLSRAKAVPIHLD
ncbi:hypothetical protein PENSPDRAFT_685119 [Peniophora sp. CONT]|nr:hypothetical protein PENSPDRAFT_685119 [Peniophora sp. CONT]